jgi:hypothetical protein
MFKSSVTRIAVINFFAAIEYKKKTNDCLAESPDMVCKSFESHETPLSSGNSKTIQVTGL